MLIDRPKLRSLALGALMATAASLSFSITLFEISSVIFIISSLLVMALEKDFSVFGRKCAIFIGLYCLAALLSISQSHHLWDSLKGLLRMARLGLLCLSVIFIVDSEKKWRWVFWVTVGCAVLVCLDGLVQGITGYEPLRQRTMTPFTAEVHRITATFRHANDFAAYLCLLFFSFAGALFAARKTSLSRWIIWIIFLGFAAVAVCLGWTLSRGAWVGVFVSLLLMSWVQNKKWIMVLGAILLCWICFFSTGAIRERIQTLGNFTSGTVSERMILWRESADMIKVSPWLGFGINTFSDNMPQFKSKTQITNHQYAHNGYVQMTVEMGHVGLGSFLALLFYFFYSNRRIARGDGPSFHRICAGTMVFGILSFLIHSATDTSLHSLLLVNNLWFSMGMVWAVQDREVVEGKR